MQTLTSIQTANRKYETGDSPVLLMCNDMQDYVCKHALNGNAVNLICEYIAASFLRVWELSVPDFCFINVNYEHVKHFTIPKHHFDKTCFGSKFSKNFVELTLFNDEPDFKKINVLPEQKLNILKIALFDLWMANEDRNFNNLNLLLDVSNGYNLVPIDHGAILNTRLLDSSISVLTETECVTNTDLMKHLHPKCDFNKEYISSLKDYFYLCTLKCQQNFDEILNYIPPDWTPDLNKVADKIKIQIFSKDWEDKVINTFLDYINSPFK
jgi:hypothetical protein